MGVNISYMKDPSQLQKPSAERDEDKHEHLRK